jgi:hypothetical protein
MIINEIYSFIYKVCGKNIPIQFVNTELKEWKFLSEFPAYVTQTNIIVINQNKWNEFDNLTQQYLLLHEIGHVEDPSNYFSSMVERELFAQVYAIEKAKNLKMFELVEMMKYILSEWEFQYKWNSPQRKYIIASRIAKKKGIVL